MSEPCDVLRVKKILQLIDICLTLRRASSAECERGFSLLKTIKSDWGSNLMTVTLEQIRTSES